MIRQGNGSKYRENRALLVSLMVVGLSACATIPQESVDLSRRIEQGLNANQKLVDDLIDANIKSDIELYRAAHRPAMWNKVSGIIANDLFAQRGGTSAEIYNGKLTLSGEDHQSIGRVQHIIDQKIEEKIREVWEEARAKSRANTKLLTAMNAAITANLEAHRTLQLRQREFFTIADERLGVEVNLVQQTVTELLTGGLDSVVGQLVKSAEGKPSAKP